MPNIMDKDKVLSLAKLSRVKISDEEAESLSHEFEAILNYVGEVKAISIAKGVKKNPKDFPVHTVMREDIDAHEGGIYTEKILQEAPSREGDYIKVKKIL